MANAAKAITKFYQTEEALRRMTRRALKRNVSTFSSRELSGGMCNAVYRVEADGEAYVIKVGPPAGVKMMRHERDGLKSEANMLRRFGEALSIPAPRLIAYDDTFEACASPYIVMSAVPGRALLALDPPLNVAQTNDVKRAVGEIARQICRLPAPCFGIPEMKETHTRSNARFVRTLFSLLLADAKDAGISLPGVSPEALMAAVEALRGALDACEAPVYAHTDTWNGNLMIENGKLSGIVDFAAVLYGDPLISHDFHDFSPAPRPAFLEGFGKTAFTPDENARIRVYRVWQRLGMVVERGYRGYEDPNQYAWVLDEFAKEACAMLDLARGR